MFVSVYNARFTRGDLPNKSVESHTGYTQRGGAYTTETSRAIIQHEVQSLAMSASGEVGIGLKTGGYSDGTCPGECKSL